MHITGGRPVRVVSLAGTNSMAANVSQVKASGISTVAPSLITMDSGGVVRNFMGSTPNDTHLLRLWGTKGAAEWDGDLVLRLGAKGNAPKFRVQPEWPEFGELAERMGHGGGDFWVLYYFARHVLFGEPAFWDVYRSAEVTLPGIFAYRSAVQNGVALDLPDFRTREDRDAFRGDDQGQRPYDWRNGPFPAEADRELLKDFTAVMSALVDTHATGARAVLDWLSVKGEMAEPQELKPVLEQFVSGFDEMRRTFHRAREIAEAYPGTDGAQMLREMLAVAEPERTEAPEFLAAVKDELAKL
jgi:hypothetical protein